MCPLTDCTTSLCLLPLVNVTVACHYALLRYTGVLDDRCVRARGAASGVGFVQLHLLDCPHARTGPQHHVMRMGSPALPPVLGDHTLQRVLQCTPHISKGRGLAAAHQLLFLWQSWCASWHRAGLSAVVGRVFLGGGACGGRGEVRREVSKRPPPRQHLRTAAGLCCVHHMLTAIMVVGLLPTGALLVKQRAPIS